MSNRTLKPETIAALDDVDMCAGLGDGKESACIMAQVNIADALEHGRPWPDEPSDRPDCVCPVIRGYCIRINDSNRLWANQAERKAALTPLIPLLIGTKSTPEVELARARIFVLSAAREIVPLVFDLAVQKGVHGLGAHAEKLRAIAYDAPMSEIREFLRSAKIAADAAAFAFADAFADADAAAAAAAAADAAAYAAAAAAAAAAADAAAYAYAAAAAAADAAAYAAAAADAAAYAYAYAAAEILPQIRKIVVRAIKQACEVV